MINPFFSWLGAWYETHPRLRRWLVGLFLCSLSAALLFPTLSEPRAIVFDETYYIPKAQRYLNNVFFVTDHPPLAQMLIALGQHWYHPDDPSNEFIDVTTIKSSWPENKDITGYRIFPAVFGMFLGLLMYLIVLLFTGSDWKAAFLGLATVLENALLTQSHYGLPDSALVFFCLLTILCFAWLQTRELPPTRKTYLAWFLFGAAAAATTLVKLTGLFALVAFPFYAYRLFRADQRKSILPYTLVFGLGFLAIFLAVWLTHFSLLTKFDPNAQYKISDAQRAILDGSSVPNPVERFAVQVTDAYKSILQYHENVIPLDLNKPGEIGSAWYQWPIGGRAIPYRWSTNNTSIRIIYLIGNPAVWIMSLLGILGGAVSLVVQLFRRQPSKYLVWQLLLVGMYLAYMFPLTMVTRVMYLYHYLPPLTLGLLLFALVFLELPGFSTRSKVELLLLMTIWVVVAFWVYSPFTYYLPLTYGQFETRNVWSPWNLRIP